MDAPATALVERTFREHSGRAVAVLTRLLGDIDAAEEAVQDAFVTALARWPADGVPPSPPGWIITTARNRAIDRLRREGTRTERYVQAALLHDDTSPPQEEGPQHRRHEEQEKFRHAAHDEHYDLTKMHRRG